MPPAGRAEACGRPSRRSRRRSRERGTGAGARRARAAAASSRKQGLDLALDRQALERLRLDLADALARHAERAADLLERLRIGVAVEAVAELEDVALALRQLLEGAVQRLLLEAHVHLLLGPGARGRDQLTELRPLVLAHRLVEARHRAGGLAHLAHPP